MMMTRRVVLPIAILVGIAVLALVVAAQLAAPSTAGDGLQAGRGQGASPTDEPPGTPGPTETPTTDQILPDQLQVATYDVFLSRDPFEPVVPVTDTGDGADTPGVPTTSTEAPATNPTNSPTASPTTSPTSSPTGSPGGASGEDPDGTGSGGGCVTDGTTVCDGHVVELVDVVDGSPPTAVVRVDQTVYEVRAGQAFADHFEALSVEGDCATLLFGDDAFTLCEGEATLK